MAERHKSVVDAHVILRREGKVLLLRRTGAVFASGQLCLPSGHHEDGEDITATAARETAEETGIIVQPTSLRMMLVMHQRNPDGQARFGFFFEPSMWEGEPVNLEPAKHSEFIWADPRRLPPDTVGYTAAAITAVEAGEHFVVNGWATPGAPASRRGRPRVQGPAGNAAPARDRHWTASAIVLDNSDRVLLIDHVKSGMWLFPGGHVDPGEALEEAALREVREETGIEAMIISGPVPSFPPMASHPLPFAVNEGRAADPVNGDHLHIDHIFVCRATTELIGQLDQTEVTGARWVSLDSMRELNVPPELPAITEAAIAWAAPHRTPVIADQGTAALLMVTSNPAKAAGTVQGIT